MMANILPEHIVEGFLKAYFRANGDVCPESGKIVLPSCITKKQVYEHYRRGVESVEAVLYPRFSQIWEKKFSKEVIQRKVIYDVLLFAVITDGL